MIINDRMDVSLVSDAEELHMLKITSMTWSENAWSFVEPVYKGILKLLFLK